MKKKIIVVDDEPLIPILMKDIIEEDQGLELAQIATGRKEFLNLVSQNVYDAGLIDISLEGREGGIELVHMVKDRGINLPLIVVSAHDELYYALKCLMAGAKGYINKKYICTDVVNCLKAIFDGQLYVSGEKREYILNEYRKLNDSIRAESI